MSYLVKEIFYSLQGEGFHAGSPAVFCRFAESDFSSHDQDLAAAECTFCDTDVVGGGRYPDAISLAEAVRACWPKAVRSRPFVVCTGGEPTLQLDNELVHALHDQDCIIAIETNGTNDVHPDIDWICVSPKAGVPMTQTHGDELKIVVPQLGLDPAVYELLSFSHRFVQPMDGPQIVRNTEWALKYCLEHPGWRLSLQTHKFLGIR
jgi:7-carboxy-7-deazaguanine synthase